MAKAVDLTGVQGDDIPFYLSDLKVDGEVIDITDYKFIMTIKENLSDTDEEALAQVRVGLGEDFEHTSPTAGTTMWYLTKEYTTNLDDEYYYDIQMIDDEGYVTTLYYGMIDFTDERTKAEE